MNTSFSKNSLKVEVKSWLEDKEMKTIALQKAMVKNKIGVNPYDWIGYALYGGGVLDG